MDIVNTGERQWLGGLNHRAGGVEFMPLFAGEEAGDDNYMFCLVLVRDRYLAPPHRHNFDQVRFMLEGAFGFGDQIQTEGQVGYFAEGVEYTQKADGRSVTLLLQTANASRSRYISREELNQATYEMRDHGRFENGHFVRSSPLGDVVQDGYEAAWEHVTGQAMAYQSPRYDRPIIMEPDRFAFVPLEGQHGVSLKKLGTFSERELEMGMASIAPGATWTLEGDRMGRVLLYVMQGDGEADDASYAAGFALRHDGDDKARLTATSNSEIFYIGLPK